MKIRRMTAQAWGAAQDLATGEQGFRPVLKRSASELREHGIVTEDGTLDPEWHRVLSSMGRAPVGMRVLGGQGDTAFHSDLVIFPGLGLVATQRRTTRTLPDGSQEVTGAEDAVEVVLFEPDEIWSAVRRVVPPIDAFRAEAKGDAREERIELTDEDRARVAAMVHTRHGEMLPPDQALDLMQDPDPRLRDMLRPEATVAIFGFARHPLGNGAAVCQWSLGKAGLYLTRSDDATGDLHTFEVEQGHLAAEVARMAARLIDIARTGERQSA